MQINKKFCTKQDFWSTGFQKTSSKVIVGTNDGEAPTTNDGEAPATNDGEAPVTLHHSSLPYQ